MNLLKKARDLVTVPTKVDVKAEMRRRVGQRDRILSLLQSGKDVYTSDLERIAYNYTMRISELRKRGHIVTAIYVKPGVWRYEYGGYNGR